MSINDFLMACFSKACKVYINKRDPDNKVKTIGTMIGFSMREKFAINNDIALTFVRVHLPSDPLAPLKGMFPVVKREMNFIKESMFKYFCFA